MYIITGGAGFIGSNIVWALEKLNLGKLIVCDRLNEGNKWRNIAKRDLWDMIAPELLFEFLDDNSSNIEAVIHMGAISSTTETDVDLIIDTNFRLSKDIWEWCAINQVRLIYASSAATYGDGSNGFDDDGSLEALAALRPLNAYGWSKNIFDRRVAKILEANEPRPPQWVGLKFFNVYGPNEYHKDRMRSVVSQVFPNALEGNLIQNCLNRIIRNMKNGGQLRDFVYGSMIAYRYHTLAPQFIQMLAVYSIVGLAKHEAFLTLTKAVYDAHW